MTTLRPGGRLMMETVRKLPLSDSKAFARIKRASFSETSSCNPAGGLSQHEHSKAQQSTAYRSTAQHGGYH